MYLCNHGVIPLEKTKVIYMLKQILQMSDWHQFAAEEYELLAAEEGNADGTIDEL